MLWLQGPRLRCRWRGLAIRRPCTLGTAPPTSPAPGLQMPDYRDPEPWGPGPGSHYHRFPLDRGTRTCHAPPSVLCRLLDCCPGPHGHNPGCPRLSQPPNCHLISMLLRNSSSLCLGRKFQKGAAGAQGGLQGVSMFEMLPVPLCLRGQRPLFYVPAGKLLQLRNPESKGCVPAGASAGLTCGRARTRAPAAQPVSAGRCPPVRLPGECWGLDPPPRTCPGAGGWVGP